MHCVLQLRGGARSSTSSSDGGAGGSGVGDDRGILNDESVGTARVVSAGVPAREEGGRSRIFDHIVEQEVLFRRILGHNQRPVSQPPVVEEHGNHHVVFSPFTWYPRPEVTWSEARLPSPPSCNSQGVVVCIQFGLSSWCW